MNKPTLEVALFLQNMLQVISSQVAPHVYFIDKKKQIYRSHDVAEHGDAYRSACVASDLWADRVWSIQLLLMI